MDDREVRRAIAFAPGHATGVFRPVLDARDPRARGSVGAGLVLELGVWAHATFRPSSRAQIVVRSEPPMSLPISTEVARRLLGERRGALRLDLRQELPVGQGFGTSAAGATAVALAAARVLGVDRTRAREVAHLADLFGGGGLGGVAAIFGGGLEIRRRAGIPPYGEVVHAPFREAIVVGLRGPPLPSPGVLSSTRIARRIASAAAHAGALSGRPTADEFFAAAERFTDRVGLAPPPLRATLRALRHRGARAFQAMFGQSFVALPGSPAARDAVMAWLARTGIRAVELRTAPRGARLTQPPRELRE